MRSPLAALVLALGLVALSCSEAGPEAPDRSARAGADGGSEGVSKRGGDPRGSKKTPSGRSETPGPGETDAPGDPSEQGEAAVGEGASGSPRSGDGGSSGPAQGEPTTSREGRDPKSGRYVYAQQGWEQFCSGTCRRRALPATQPIDMAVTRAGAGTLELVTEVRSSEDRSVRSTSLLSSDALDITKVELRYGTLSNTYEPAPPVRSLRLPLSVGDAWTSSWTAETSGRYEARVVERDPLVVDGRRIPTFKLKTVTELRGELRGSLIATVWIDPDTATTVRTSGRTRVTTDLGRFASEFDTMLIDGPGY